MGERMDWMDGVQPSINYYAYIFPSITSPVPSENASLSRFFPSIRCTHPTGTHTLLFLYPIKILFNLSIEKSTISITSLILKPWSSLTLPLPMRLRRTILIREYTYTSSPRFRIRDIAYPFRFPIAYIQHVNVNAARSDIVLQGD